MIWSRINSKDHKATTGDEAADKEVITVEEETEVVEGEEVVGVAEGEEGHEQSGTTEAHKRIDG